jgi:hypothetical protein
LQAITQVGLEILKRWLPMNYLNSGYETLQYYNPCRERKYTSMVVGSVMAFTQTDTAFVANGVPKIVHYALGGLAPVVGVSGMKSFAAIQPTDAMCSVMYAIGGGSLYYMWKLHGTSLLQPMQALQLPKKFLDGVMQAVVV